MRAAAAGLAVVFALVAWGCAYAPRSVVRGDIRTVYVAGFDNETFRRGLEVHLTRAVQEELRLRSPLLFAARDEADSILTGSLIEFTESAHLKDVDDRVLINRVTARVRFRWFDRLTGTDIVPPTTVTETARIAEEFEESLHDLVLQKVAESVVEHMQEPW